jgi:uncharacterized membrane protein (UPF0127 family)
MAPFDTETPHESSSPGMYAIEVNQGWFGRHDVGVGTHVRFSPELTSYIEERR